MYLNKPILRVGKRLYMLHEKKERFIWLSLFKGHESLGNFVTRELALNYARERVRAEKSRCQLIEISERH